MAIERVAAEAFFPWQRDFISAITDGPCKYIGFEKSRRIGGTWACAFAALDYCLRWNQNCWFSSSDELNSKEFILYVKEAAHLYNVVLGFTFIDLEAANSETVYLPNGRKISALSSNPRALRGKDGLIFWDEAALHEQQEDFYRAAHGCTVQRGKLVILSTHNGPTTLFNRLMREAETGKTNWRHFRVTLVDAVQQGYAKRFGSSTDEDFIQKVRDGCLHAEHFGQEFMCKPLALGSLISEQLYDEMAIWPVSENLESFISGSEMSEKTALVGSKTPISDTSKQTRVYNDLFMGIDVGRTHDLTVCYVVERYENKKATNLWDQYDYKTVCVKSIKNQPFPSQYQQLRPLVGHPAVRGCFVDRGAVGRSLADAFCDEFADRCMPFDFLPHKQAEIAERVKGYMEAKRLSVPNNLPQCRDDFLCVQRQASPRGNLQYVGNTASTHADHFWAAAMAIASAEENLGVIIV